MLLDKQIKFGDVSGTIYEFENAGDILAKHVHTEDNVHVTIVTNGKLKAYSHDWSIEANPGQIIDFKVGEPHELMALEDNTKVINILKKKQIG